MKLNTIQIVLIVVIIIFAILIITTRTSGKAIQGCKSDQDCTPGRCNQGTCQECVFDSDCIGSATCERGTCKSLDVQPPPPPPPGPTCDPTCSLIATPTVFAPPFTDQYNDWDVEVQSTGKIISTGARKMIRYNEDGSIDTTFATGGIFDFETLAPGISVQQGINSVFIGPDDSIYVVPGLAFDLNDPQGRWIICFKFTPDGVIDVSVAEGGYFYRLSSSSGSGCLGPDGSIYLTVNEGVIKYTPAGVLDVSFGVNGVFNINNTILATTINWFDTTEIALNDVGQIMYGGRISIGQISQNTHLESFGSLRINADGTLDLTYGDNGMFIAPYSTFGYNAQDCYTVQALGTTYLPDGTMFIGGFVGMDILSPPGDCWDLPLSLIKVTKDGQLDTTWGVNGVFIFMDPDIGAGAYYECARQFIANPCDGSLIVAFISYGSNTTTDRVSFLAKLTPDGQLDTITTISSTPQSYYHEIHSMTRSPTTGNIIVSGRENNVPRLWEYTCEMTVPV